MRVHEKSCNTKRNGNSNLKRINKLTKTDFNYSEYDSLQTFEKSVKYNMYLLLCFCLAAYFLT